MEWVIAGAAIVQAIAAAVIVVFTKVSLDKSEKMSIVAAGQVEATQEQMRQSALPVIAFEVGDSPMKDVRTSAAVFSLLVSNVGVGPALDLEIIATIDDEIPELRETANWSGHALAAGSETMALDFSLDSYALLFARGEESVRVGRIDLRYVDVYKRPGELHGDLLFRSRVPSDNKHFAFVPRSYVHPGGALVQVEFASTPEQQEAIRNPRQTSQSSAATGLS